MARFDLGRQLFTLCAPCHGQDGRGTMAQVPSLAGSERVLGAPEPLAAILLHGLEGPIDSSGQSYDGSMPPALLHSDEQIAAVLTFIRRAWDNQAEPVSPEQIAEVRTRTLGRVDPWTAQELSEVTW